MVLRLLCADGVCRGSVLNHNGQYNHRGTGLYRFSRGLVAVDLFGARSWLPILYCFVDPKHALSSIAVTRCGTVSILKGIITARVSSNI